MKTIRHKKTIILILVLASILLLVINYHISHQKHMEQTELFLSVSPYINQERDWIPPEKVYPEGTGENLFIKGMDSFISKDYIFAKILFEQALSAPYSDVALPTYCYYFINECIFNSVGIGDFEVISNAFNTAGRCHPVANDEEMLQQMINSVTISATAELDLKENSSKAISIMENYLKNNHHLDDAAWARMKNGIAVLQYYNQEYAASMRNFYDVEVQLEFKESSPDAEKEYLFAIEYLANLYYIFEDYDTCVIMYQNLIDSTNEQGPDSQFSFYINMSTAYLEMGNSQKALETIQEFEALSYALSEESYPEISAYINYVYAKIYMEDKLYPKAEEHLTLAESYHKNNKGSIFMGGEYFIMLTRAEFLLLTGKYTDAEINLKNALNSDAVYYGLEKEIYEHLSTLYQKTGQKEKLLPCYERIVELNKESAKTTYREYLEFSEYYRDAIYLENANYELTKQNIIFLLALLGFVVFAVIVLILIKHLRTKNLTDQLTGVYNRKKLNILKRKYKRNGTPESFGVIMMDVDYFKKYNDTYGHPAGDEILRQVAGVLKDSLRSKDIIIRYGGEEFLVLLYEVQINTANNVCQRIKTRLTDLAIPHSASDTADYVTLSMGLCYQNKASNLSLEQLIEVADECLYKSKEAGRNRATTKEL